MMMMVLLGCLGRKEHNGCPGFLDEFTRPFALLVAALADFLFAFAGRVVSLSWKIS